MLKKLISAAFLFGLCSTPAMAQNSFEMPVKGEILSGWIQSDGTRMAAIRLTLAPGWKTYWRAPGDAGIPPQISWSGSKNLRSVAISWPTPKVFDQGGIRSLGYQNELVLPLTLTPRQPGQKIVVHADMDLGVCSDICVPHQMTLTASISDNQTTPSPAIAAALASTPYSAKEAGVRSAKCSLSPNANGMMITATLTMPPAGGSEVVVIEPGQPGLWMSETDTSRSGSRLTAVGDIVAGDDTVIALDRSKIRISVIGKNHAVDIRGCPSG